MRAGIQRCSAGNNPHLHQTQCVAQKIYPKRVRNKPTFKTDLTRLNFLAAQPMFLLLIQPRVSTSEVQKRKMSQK